MILYLIEEDLFKLSNPDVKPEDLNMTHHTVLGKSVLVLKPDLEPHLTLAEVVTMLKARLEKIEREGNGEFYVSFDGTIWRKKEIEEDIARMELSPGYDYSVKCLQAKAFVQLTGEHHDF